VADDQVRVGQWRWPAMMVVMMRRQTVVVVVLRAVLVAVLVSRAALVRWLIGGRRPIGRPYTQARATRTRMLRDVTNRDAAAMSASSRA
jgi:hypothetical protein